MKPLSGELAFKSSDTLDSPTLDRQRLRNLIAREMEHFASRHPASRALHERAQASMIGGVPMPWMARWPGAFPIYVREASGSRIVDVDQHTYVDLCLGDTGAMGGHSPDALVRAVQMQVGRGITMMLPTDDSLWVAEELARRFQLDHWQFTLSATDANRCALPGRLRAVTGFWFSATATTVPLTRRLRFATKLAQHVREPAMSGPQWI